MVEQRFTAKAVIPEAPFDWDIWYLVETFALEAIAGRDHAEFSVEVRDDEGTNFTGESVTEVRDAVEKRGTKVNFIHLFLAVRKTPIGPRGLTMHARGDWYSGEKAEAEYITFNDPVDFESDSEPEAKGLAVSFDSRIKRFFEQKKKKEEEEKEKAGSPLRENLEALQNLVTAQATEHEEETGRLKRLWRRVWPEDIYGQIVAGVIAAAIFAVLATAATATWLSIT